MIHVINVRKFVAAAALCSAIGAGALTLPDIVNRNMMLQQNTDASLWGWAAPGSTV